MRSVMSMAATAVSSHMDLDGVIAVQHVVLVGGGVSVSVATAATTTTSVSTTVSVAGRRQAGHQRHSEANCQENELKPITLVSSVHYLG